MDFNVINVFKPQALIVYARLLQARSAWLQRLCWPKAMAHWLANGEKSRNAVRVSPPGIHFQGQKVKIVLATVLGMGSAILTAIATKFQM